MTDGKRPYISEVLFVHRVIDGDTIIAECDVGFYHKCHQHFRVLGIDTPELNSKDPAEREKAQTAKVETTKWFDTHMPGVILVESFKTDSFGRWLGRFWCEQDQSDLAEELLKGGYAVPYRRTT